MEPYAPAIEAEMRALVDRSHSPQLARFYGMMAYHLGWRDAERRPASCRTGKWIWPATTVLNRLHLDRTKSKEGNMQVNSRMRLFASELGERREKVYNYLTARKYVQRFAT